MAVGLFTLTAQRASVVDPTHALMHDNWFLIFKKSEFRSDIWNFYRYPFQIWVFVAVGGSLACTFLLVLAFELHERKFSQIGNYDMREEREKISQWFVTLQVFGTLVAALLNKCE